MPRVALTFDDGPGPSTPALLEILAARGVHATFFLLGQNIEGARQVALAVARAGHRLGNHTFSHARPGALSPAALADEIRRTDALLDELCAEAGRPAGRPWPLRLPYGPEPGDPRPAVLAALGRAHLHWTGDFGDWKDPPPAELCARMQAHIRAQAAAGLGAVIDLHDSSRRLAPRASTVEAVRLLLEDPALEVYTVP